MQLFSAGNSFAINLAFTLFVVGLIAIAFVNAEVISTHGNMSPINVTTSFAEP